MNGDSLLDVNYFLNEDDPFTIYLEKKVLYLLNLTIVLLSCLFPC